jgi:hypothetical protein
MPFLSIRAEGLEPPRTFVDAWLFAEHNLYVAWIETRTSHP